MARIMICFSLLLQACASHVVPCDAHLQAINAPEKKASGAEAAADAGKSAP